MSRPNINRIFLINVKTQFENLGDALINRELIRLLSPLGTVVIGLSTAPPAFRRSLSSGLPRSVRILESSWRFYFELARALFLAKRGGPAAHLVLNPGGYTGDHSAAGEIKSLLRVSILRALKWLGIRVLLIGVSYEDIGRRHAKSLGRLAALLDIHMVRDSGSIAFCRAEGIHAVGPIPDLAFALEGDTSLPANNGRLILSVRRVDEKIRDALGEVLEWAKAHNLEVSLSSQVHRDAAFMEELRELYNLRGANVELEQIDDALRFYGRQSIVVSNRLHVLILAWRAGSIPVPILRPGKNNKIRNLFTDLGLQDLIIEVDDPASISSSLSAVSRTALGERLFQIFQEQGEKLREVVSEKVREI